MSDALDRRRLLTSARAELLDRPDADLPGIRGGVAASWRRSVARGVDPSVLATRYHPDLDVESRLARYARPVIGQLAEQTADIPVCIALTDDQARLLIRLDTSLAIGRVADGNTFAAGFGFAEPAVGTNGVGTVLEAGESVQIVGAEHFVEQLHPYACTGAPVHDPFTGRIAGVIDISCWAEQYSPLLHSLARSAAARIQRDLLRDRDPAQQAMFDVYSRIDARTRRAVLAVGQRTVMANATMQTLLAPGDLVALQDHARFVMFRGPTVDDRVDLPSGVRVRLQGTAVPVGGTVAGLVGVVTVLREVSGHHATRATPDDRAPVPEAHSQCAAYRAAWRAAGEAVRAGTPVLIVGEPGSGRRRLIAELDAALHGRGHVIEVEPEGPGPDLAARIRRAGPSPLLVLRDIDRRHDDAPARLLATLDGCAARLAATAADTTRRGAAPDALLSRFRRSVTVPPLRYRSGDLPELAASLLAELAPGRDVKLSPEAVRTLTRYGWPGNVRELRDALDAALRRSPASLIRFNNLPEFCQSAPRSSLRPVDRAERDAIVEALRDSSGNRVAAAAALGVARSTLYRKIAHYRITE